MCLAGSYLAFVKRVTTLNCLSSRSRRPRQNFAVKALNPWPIESEDQVTLKAADPFTALANGGYVLAGVRSRFNSSLRVVVGVSPGRSARPPSSSGLPAWRFG